MSIIQSNIPVTYAGNDGNNCIRILLEIQVFLHVITAGKYVKYSKQYTSKVYREYWQPLLECRVKNTGVLLVIIAENYANC